MKRIRFETNPYGNWYSDCGLVLCGDGLRDWFDFPSHTATVWFCVGATDHRNAYRVYGFTGFHPFHADTDAGFVELDGPVARLIGDYINEHGSAYVSLEVEA